MARHRQKASRFVWVGQPIRLVFRIFQRQKHAYDVFDHLSTGTPLPALDSLLESEYDMQLKPVLRFQVEHGAFIVESKVYAVCGEAFPRGPLCVPPPVFHVNPLLELSDRSGLNHL